MFKQAYIFIIVFAFALTVYGQKPEPVIAKAFYSFTHIIDTTQPDKPQKETMILLLGKGASQYISQDYFDEIDALQKSIQQQVKEEGGLKSINIKKSGRTTRDQIFFYTDKNQLFFQKRLGFTNYLVEEPAYKIKWNIAQDTMSIEGVSCFKATARFRGRNWIAWFAPELPFQAGPWKLHGLPGLILTAHDERNEVIFSFAGFESVKNQERTREEKVENSPNGISLKMEGYDEFEIKLPANAVRTSKKEFNKLEVAMKKDPKGFMETQMAGSGVTMTVVAGKPIGTAATSKPVVLNNPIELSDN